MVRIQKVESFYAKLRESAISSDSQNPLLIFPSSSDVDSICALKVITHILESDSIQYSCFPVSSFLEIHKYAGPGLCSSSESPVTILLINWGCHRDLRLVLTLGPKARVFVVDSHRPIHLHNLSDGNDSVVVLHTDDDERQADLAYDFDVLKLANESYQMHQESADVDESEDEDEEESDDDSDRPSKRRKMGGDGVKLFKKLKRDYYKMGTFHGKPSGCLLFELSHILRKNTNELLWLACVSLPSSVIVLQCQRRNGGGEKKMTAAGVASVQTKKLLKFSLSLFRRGFNSSKCKTAAKMAVARIKLLRNKRQVVVKQMRRDIALLLQSGQDATARIRVEHVIREQNILAANEIIELFCELIVSRLTIITKQKECPVDLKEGIASLIFAAPRCSEIPELGDLKDIFGKKYGRDFVTAATELRPTCGVNRMLIDKLSVRHPGGEFKLKIMKEIAKEFQVDWDTAETEQELLKPQEETIDGPRAFVSASSLPVNRASDDPIDPTKAVPRSSSSMSSINTHYHDTESAAEAAAELAKQAVAAAQVAALLANRRDSNSNKEFSVSSSSSLDHSRRQSETSSYYYAKPSVANRRYSCNNEEDYAKTEAEAKETMRRRHTLPPPATSEVKFDESDYYEEDTEPEEGPLQRRASSLPPDRAPPQAPESRRDSSGHHVHPKLPDYDELAARFDAIRHSKGPLI